MGGSWEHFGGIWGLFGGDFVAWTAVLMGFAEILKNLEKHCKVLQNSRFGGSENHEKMTLEDNLGPNLDPSLLIECNFELRGAS